MATQKLPIVSIPSDPNNVLACEYFLIFRLRSEEKYFIGAEYQICLKGIPVKRARLISEQCYFLKDVPLYLCYLAAAADKDLFVAGVEKHFDNINPASLFAFYLFETVTE